MQRKYGATGQSSTAASTKPYVRRKQASELPIHLIVVFMATLIVLANLIMMVGPPDHQQSQSLPGIQRRSDDKPAPLKKPGISKEILANNARGESQGRTKVTDSQPKSSNGSDEPFYHIVFSTSCAPQQHWESYVLFYHAWKVGQRGNITRILSGCSDKDVKIQTEFFKEHISSKLSDRFHLHFTPDYAKVYTGKGDKKAYYKYMNKPMGLLHWFEHFLGYKGDDPKMDDGIVFLIDPDQILLKPLTHDFRNDPSAIFVMGDELHESKKYVHHGNPMAQQDGYLHSKWMDFNMTSITGDPHSPAYKVKNNKRDGPHFYNTGPPYLATVQDMYKITFKWVQYAPRIYLQFTGLFCEMFGYVIATAHMQMPHTMLRNLVVSTTMTNDREGWPLVDALPTVCPSLDVHHPDKLPYILHYCKRYLVGKFFWSKYRLRKDYLNCEPPLLEEPNATLDRDYSYYIAPPPHNPKQADNDPTPHDLSEKTVKREAFMLCGMIPKVNEAVTYWKQHACEEGTANYSKVYNFFNMP